MNTRDTDLAVVKSAFQVLGKKAIVSYVSAKLPFLASKFMSPFLGWFAGIAAEAIVKSTDTAAFFLFIDMRAGKQSKSYEAAALENYHAQQNGTPEEKARAAAKLKKEFLAFASLTN